MKIKERILHYTKRNANVNYRTTRSSEIGGFRLGLDTYEKAKYFGKQFLELWAEYLSCNFTVISRFE